MEKRDLIYQSQQIREFEKLAAEKFDISAAMLMQKAGAAVFEVLNRKWPAPKKISVFCGDGNNGGDGFVVAYLASTYGYEVTIYRLSLEEPKSAIAKEALDKCLENKIPVVLITSDTDFSETELVVDAILGIGLSETVREPLKVLLEKLSKLTVPVLAIDVPTGINADTGAVQGFALKANITVTLIALKLGLLTGDGPSYAGDIILNTLELPDAIFNTIHPVAEKIHFGEFAAKYLTPRPRAWHKGLSGHVLVIGGDKGFSGAPKMAAVAAMRVGAGLVTVATHPDNAPYVNFGFPELMSHGVSAARDLEPLLERVNTIVIGPGLGVSQWAQRLWRTAIMSGLPLVIDADALNILAAIKHREEHWILTPHPGEAAKLLNTTSTEIQADRLSALHAIEQQYGGVCVLKGVGSLVSSTPCTFICDKGNPGLSTAGTGDILSGVIGGLLAQGIPLADAAKTGVSLHAHAGDMAAKEGERGMMAMDIVPFLRRLSNYHKPL